MRTLTGSNGMNFLKKFFGYCLSGSNNEPYIFVFTGNSDAIDGVVQVLRRLLGDSYCDATHIEKIPSGCKLSIFFEVKNSDKILATKEVSPVLLVCPGNSVSLPYKIKKQSIALKFKYPISFLKGLSDEEMSGVLNWAIQGFHQWEKEGF